MNDLIYHRKLQRALDFQGGLYSLNDIRERVEDRRMQSWDHNHSWAVTQISIYPQKRILEIVAAVGDLGDCRILHGRILAFAKEMGVDLVAAYGRRGWARDAERNGWKVKSTSYLYHKELR
jgi:hypothetical protein